MFREKKKGRLLYVLAGVFLCLVLLAAVLTPVFRKASTAIDEQSIQSVKDAVMRSAVQCYAVEGAYPNSVAYLEEHYGLVINHERYIVSYEAYSSNLAPSIRVLPLGSEDGEGY